MPDFLIRIAADWGQAVTSTRQAIQQITDAMQKLDRLAPTDRARELTRGTAAIGQASDLRVATGVATPREAERTRQQVLAPLQAAQAGNATAMADEVVARKQEAAAVRLRAEQELAGNEVYQATQAELAAATKRRAAVANQAAALDLESDEKYIAVRAEALAAQQRTNAEIRAQAAAINGGGAGAAGGGLLGGLGGLGGLIGGGALIGAGFGVYTQVRQAVTEALKLNQQLAVLKDQAASIGQQNGFDELRTSIIATAKETGVASTDVATLASEFLGLYGDTTAAAQATEDASKLLRVIGGDAKTAGPAIAALANDLNVSVQDVGNAVIDLQDKTGRSGQDMLAALGQVAPVAAGLNLTLDQTRGIIEAVGIGGAKTGQQLGDLLARILPQLEEKLPKLQALGINISPAARQGDAAAALRDILTSVTPQNQDEVTAALGGPRAAQAFAAVLQNRSRALAAFDGQLSDHDLLNKRSAASEDALQGAIQKFHQSLVGLGDAIVNSGVSVFLQDLITYGGGAINILTGMVRFIGELNSSLGGLPARLAEVALAIKGLIALGGLGAGGAAAGASGGLLGGLLGGGGAAAGATGLGVEGTLTSEGLLSTSGGVAAGIGGPATIIAALATAWALQAGADVQKHAKNKHDELVQQFEQQSTEELKSQLGQGNHDTNWYDRPLFDIGIKSTYHPVNADDIRNKTIADRQANAGQQAMSAYADASKAAIDSRSALAKQVAAITGNVVFQATSLQDILDAYQQGDITFQQAIASGKAFLGSETGYSAGTPGYKQSQTDTRAFAKFQADIVKQNLQLRLDTITSTGQAPADELRQEIAAVQSALKDPASGGDQTTTTDLQNKLASLLSQQHKQTIQDIQSTTSSNLALRKALNGDDPSTNAKAEVDALQSELDQLVKGGADQQTVTGVNAQLIQAQNDYDKTQADIAKARLEYVKAQNAGSPLAQARADQDIAAIEVANAQGDAARLTALAHQVSADQSFETAMHDIAISKLEILKAQHEAAGNLIGAAQDQLGIDQSNIAEFLKVHPGANAEGNDFYKGYLDLQRQLVSDQASAAQTSIQQAETSVDQDLQLRRISVQQAVSRLRDAERLATSDQQRNEIELKIQQLLEAGSNFQFGIPQDVKVPTSYEVRRFEATQSAGIGYNDNRQLNVQMYITNGMDQAAAKTFIGDLFGVSSQVIGAASRNY